MANPRKFSDKLEIIRRKEEEANAAFVQIMREVSDARKGSPVHSTLQSHQHGNWNRNQNNDYMKMRQKYKGGSLPNVNLSPNPVNLNQNLYAGMNDGFGHQQQQQQYGGVTVGGSGVRRNMDPPAGPIYPSRQNKYRSYTVTSPYRNNLLPQQQQPSLIEEQNDAPSMWRRTYSDSAIQQSLQLPPKSNTNGNGLLQQSTGGSRIIQTANQSIGHTDRQSFARIKSGNTPPCIKEHIEERVPTHHKTISTQQHGVKIVSSSPVSLQFDSGSHKNNIHIQADTSSLPDLSNLSIPSPIQNPIDAEHAEGKANIKREQQQNLFQAPYRIPSRRSVGKQMYSRPVNSSTSDIIDTLQREQKPNLNLFQDVSVCSSSVTASNPAITHSVSAPLSPVTPQSFFWNTTPISPLATGDILQQASSAPAPTSDLQQQLFQIPNDNLRNNGIGNPSPYNFQSDEDSYENYCSNNFINNKQNVYRINSGPAHLSSSNSKLVCDHQLESALMRVKAQDGGGDLHVGDVESVLLRVKASQGNELSQADLNSVRVALDPLDFDDVQMLQDNNAQIVDQSAEEQFRLERASYQ